MTFNAPITSARADRLIEILELPPAANVLDVGCGNGEWLARIARRWGVARGLGVDHEAACIQAARLAHPALEWREADAGDLEIPDDSLDLAVCVGATHAFSMGEPACAETLKRFGRWVKPGGLVLLGEGLWERPPSRDFLDFLGEHPGVYRDHAGNIELARSFGLVPLYALVSTPAEWDDFQWTHTLRGERAGGERRARRWSEAAEHLSASLALSRALEIPRNEAAVLAELGDLARARGDAAGAAARCWSRPSRTASSWSDGPHRGCSPAGKTPRPRRSRSSSPRWTTPPWTRPSVPPPGSRATSAPPPPRRSPGWAPTTPRPRCPRWWRG